MNISVETKSFPYKKIMNLWESRCRKEISCLEKEDSQIVCKGLEMFLQHLALNLTYSDPHLLPKEREIIIRHGEQRTELPTCSLNDIIREYAILRQVILEVMGRENGLGQNETRTLNAVIDSAMELAGERFVKIGNLKIQSALSKAEESNQALEQFASIVAHDFKSPLATLSGFTEALEEDLKAASQVNEIDSTLKCMKSAIRRATDLVDGLLNYSRIGSQKPDFESIDMNHVLQAALDNLQNEISANGARIIADPLPSVHGSFFFLVQLFQNLISNSLKFRNAQAPNIQITSREISEKWQFEVKDNGIGFPEQNRELIFQLHNRAHSGYDGNGIGLATCRRVVELHQGQIWANSKPGQGAQFIFALPKTKH